jgi:hypothetical protein
MNCGLLFTLFASASQRLLDERSADAAGSGLLAA